MGGTNNNMLTMDEVEEKELELEQSGKKKKAKAKNNNVDEIVDALSLLGYEFAYNELSKELEFCKDEAGPFILDDYVYSQILVQLWREGYNVKESTLQRIIVGAMAESYHPIKQYFDSLPKWDGIDHISKLAETVIIDDMGLDLKQKWPEYLRKWLVACAAQATIEKATNHSCLVLMGAQGKGKTTFLNALCPVELSHLSFTGHINVTEKDTYNLLAERLIINIDDQLDIMGDLRKLKSMFTLEKVVNRKAYAKFSPSRPRIASFVASVNSTEFLTDDENRRYLVFSILDINLKELTTINRTQLWAQIKYLLNSGLKYWFDKEENDVISSINDSFRVKTEEEELLTQYFESDNVYGTPLQQTEILNFLQARTSSRLSARKLATALKKRNFVRKSARLSNKDYPVYIYMVRELNDMDRSDRSKELKEAVTEVEPDTYKPNPIHNENAPF